MLKRIGWLEPQVDADMHLKQCCRHLSSVDMVLHAFFGDCVLWLFHVLFLWTWSCIHSLEIVFSDCSNSSMEFYRTSLCERHSTGSSTRESFGRSLKWMQRCIESNTCHIFLLCHPCHHDIYIFLNFMCLRCVISCCSERMSFLFDSELSCVCLMREWYVWTCVEAMQDDPALPTFLSRDLESSVTLNFHLLEVCCFHAVWNICFFWWDGCDDWGGTGMMVSFMWRTVWIWSNCALGASKCHHFYWKNSWPDLIVAFFNFNSESIAAPAVREAFLEVFVGLSVRSRHLQRDHLFNLRWLWQNCERGWAWPVMMRLPCLVWATCRDWAALGRSLGPEAVGDGGADM